MLLDKLVQKYIKAGGDKMAETNAIKSKINQQKAFEIEKKYVIGETTFMVKHEYSGSQNISELITNAILKHEISPHVKMK